MAARKSASSKSVDQVLKALLILARTVEQVLESRAVQIGAGGPLSSSKVQILRQLDRQGEKTATYLARLLGVTKPAVSQIIDSMVNERLVKRTIPRHDRREVSLSLTQKGRDLFYRVRRQQRLYVREVLSEARSGPGEKWVQVLDRISRSLAEAGDGLEYFCAQCVAHDDACVLANSTGAKGEDAGLCAFLADVGATRERRFKTGATA